VPDAQWAAIEPHIGPINQHVTQLEQRYAPLKGYSPEGIQGLAQFAQEFERDPVGMWMRTARMLQDRGVPGIADMDLDHLEALLSGQEPPDDDYGAAVGGIGGFPPEATQLIQQLQQKVDQLEQGFTTQQQQSRERTEDAALQRQLSWMKNQLSEAGIQAELLTPERLLSQFIAHRGNAQAAVKDAQEYRTAILQGLVPDPNNPTPRQQRRTLEQPNGNPPAPQRKAGTNRRGMFADVTSAAEQAVARMNQEE
jgi:hypothetical protein